MTEEIHEVLATLLEFYPKIFFIPKDGTINKQFEALKEVNDMLEFADMVGYQRHKKQQELIDND